MIDRAALASPDILEATGEFLRLYTTDGDASPLTLKTYHIQTGQFVKWCDAHGVNPVTATEQDVLA